MNIFRHATGFSRHGLTKQSLACLLSLALLFATWPLSLSAQDAPALDTQAPPQGGQAAPYAQQTPEQLQRLVTPIALVSGFAGGADPGGVHISRRSRRSRQMGAGAS